MADPSQDLGALLLAVGRLEGRVGLDVPPDAPLSDVVCMGRGDSVFLRHSVNPERGSANFQHLFGSQPRLRRVFAPATPAPALGSCVGVVDRLCAPEEVAGVAARRVVACVKRAVPITRPWFSGKNERDVRGFCGRFGRKHEVPVTARLSTGGPRPAVVPPALVDLCPKAGFRAVGNIVYGEYSHGALQSHSGQDRAALQRCAGPFSLAESRYVRNCGGAS